MKTISDDLIILNKQSILHILAIIGSFILIFMLSIGNIQQASANDAAQKTVSIVLIGDSYTSGNGAGSYIGEGAAYRSSKNWGNKYALWLNTRGVRTTLTNLAFSRSVTSDINEYQITQVPINTDLVMLTAGGNDAEFTEVVKQCFVMGMRDPAGCRKRVDYAVSTFSNIIAGTEDIFENLQNRLSHDAQIVLVGYPLLSTNTTYVLEQCVKIKIPTGRCLEYDRYDAAKEVRNAGEEFNKLQAEFVKKWNASNPLKVTFVSSIQSSFATHEPAPHATSKNSKRWINEFLETNGYTDGISDTKAIPSGNQNYWYHPNITGHQKIALDIINQVGIPSSAKEITSTSNNFDIAFVVDTTSSMLTSIDDMKRNINEIYYGIRQNTNSSRFALVEYRDHPEYGGDSSDYPFQVLTSFTDQLRFTNSVLGLQASGGGDWEESVYSGAMAALDLDWRPGVRKLMIIIGDAPAKNPEPVTAYSWQQVLQRSYEIDPVEVYSIDAGGVSLSSSIHDLVERSGGQSFSAIKQASSVSDLILAAFGNSTAKPFGWIQGPYVAKVGDTIELDGRGSYSIDGIITTIEWDLDGDGEFETSSSELLYSHQFNSEFEGTIGIRLTDSNGKVGVGSTQLSVSDDGDSIPREIDNCPDIANQSQADDDGDGIGDDCDGDIGWPSEDKEGVTIITDDNLSSQEKEDDDSAIFALSRPISPSTDSLQQQNTIQATSVVAPAVLSWEQSSSLSVNQPAKNIDKPHDLSSQFPVLAIGLGVATVTLCATVMMLVKRKNTSL